MMSSRIHRGATSNVSISGPAFLQTQAMDKSGLALTSPDGGLTLYSYYVDIDGSILENKWENGLWLTSGHNVSNTYVVTSDAVENSPLAAISYTLNSTTYVRHSHVHQKRAFTNDLVSASFSSSTATV